MVTEVIILAQGTQRRLGRGVGPKQLLPLPACGNTPIIERTIRQAVALLSESSVNDVVVTVVTWEAVRVALRTQSSVRCFELPDPGNSSLKGIARYLESRNTVGVDRTIVLFGDCVYSWACLNALRMCSASHGFVGTGHLSEAMGELWGVAWAKTDDSLMMVDLRDALLRHPPFADEYQPGQMRRWIMGLRRGTIRSAVAHMHYSGVYFPIDDYTHDIDVPEHLALIPALSELASRDDAAYGITW